MKKKTKRWIPLSALLLPGVFLPPAAAWPAPGPTPCGPFASGYIAWIQQKPGQVDGSHAVGVKMATVKIKDRNPDTYPWGYGSYTQGRLGLHGSEMTGRLTVLFSDRRAPATQDPFWPAKADIDDVTVFADGRVRIVLVSWGSATLWLEDVTCYTDGFITGIRREGNGVSMVSLALRKEIMHPGRDDFRKWPK